MRLVLKLEIESIMHLSDVEALLCCVMLDD
jgi:hypothetical protein